MAFSSTSHHPQNNSSASVLSNTSAMAVVPFHHNLDRLSHRFQCLVCPSVDFSSQLPALEHARVAHRPSRTYRWICLCDGRGVNPVVKGQLIAGAHLTAEAQPTTETTSGEEESPSSARVYLTFSSYKNLAAHAHSEHPSMRLAQPIICSCGEKFRLERLFEDHVVEKAHREEIHTKKV